MGEKNEETKGFGVVWELSKEKLEKMENLNDLEDEEFEDTCRDFMRKAAGFADANHKHLVALEGTIDRLYREAEKRDLLDEVNMKKPDRRGEKTDDGMVF